MSAFKTMGEKMFNGAAQPHRPPHLRITGIYDSEYYEVFSKWCLDHYDWSFPQEQLCVSPGIIPAL